MKAMSGIYKSGRKWNKDKSQEFVYKNQFLLSALINLPGALTSNLGWTASSSFLS